MELFKSTEKSKVLFIIGGKSTAIEILECAKENINIEFSTIYLVIGDDEEEIHDIPFIRDVELESILIQDKHQYYYILSFSNHELRSRYLKKLNNKNIKPVNIIHSSVKISISCKIGNGNYIAAGTIISSNAVIGNNCLINYQCTIGHDSTINDNCVLNPGVRVSGNTVIGDRVLIGSNSVILQGRKIGNDSYIDALTHVDRDLDEKMICTSKSLKVFKRVVF